jgi:hypothetical protein
MLWISEIVEKRYCGREAIYNSVETDDLHTEL